VARRSNIPGLTAALLAATWVSSCRPAQERPVVNYFLAGPDALAAIRRVALVELGSQDCLPGVAEDMTAALSQALQARRSFHVQVVRRTDPAWRELAVDDEAAITLEQVRDIRQAFNADAVLLGLAKEFRPHPRTRIGLYLRMIDLAAGKPVWVVDDHWDTTEKATEKRIRRFFDEQMRSGYEPMDWRLPMVSPKAFEAFVAYEVAHTLPGASVAVQPATRPAGP